MALAQNAEDEYKTDQDVEVYDPTKDTWISGKIYDIRKDGGKNVYCVQYEEYCQEICQKDAHSALRIPETNNRDPKGAFLNFRKQIPIQLPVFHETQVLLHNTRTTAPQRMTYLYMKTKCQQCSLTPSPLLHNRASNVARPDIGCKSGVISEDGYCLWIER